MQDDFDCQIQCEEVYTDQLYAEIENYKEVDDPYTTDADRRYFDSLEDK